MKYLILTILLSIILISGCSEIYVQPPDFDGERALSFLEKQVDFGPRVPGSESSENCRNFYYNYFDSLGIKVDSQKTSFLDPYSKTEIPLVNVIATVKGTVDTSHTILLIAHYDSRPRGEYASTPELQIQPIDGANDGASGVAVLMELAAMMSTDKPPGNVALLFVDGEDWGKPGHSDYYLLGSKKFAQQGIRGKYDFAIVIDMVGDKDQNFYREKYSEKYNKPLNDLIWKIAAQKGIKTFIDSTKHEIMDDHLPIIAAGVPAVDIIDFDYAYWHTEEDTPDKCSAESLKNVGVILAEIIYNKSLWEIK